MVYLTHGRIWIYNRGFDGESARWITAVPVHGDPRFERFLKERDPEEAAKEIGFRFERDLGSVVVFEFVRAEPGSRISKPRIQEPGSYLVCVHGNASHQRIWVSDLPNLVSLLHEIKPLTWVYTADTLAGPEPDGGDEEPAGTGQEEGGEVNEKDPGIRSRDTWG
jgi:hypothetical protein